jgi:nucleoside-diphosphate-sugar epimerase
MRVFVTGASGWIGSAVVPELIGAGHEVVGLARSDDSAAAISAAGGEALRGTLDDLETLNSAAAASDGVIHLAFKHDLAFAGDFEGAAGADRKAVETIGDALKGTGRPYLIASGVLALAPGRLVTEDDQPDPEAAGSQFGHGPRTRLATAKFVISLADSGVRAGVVRLPPTVHGDGDHGFIATLVGIARESRKSGYIGDGSARWPAVHRSDAARLFRLALEGAPAGSVLHAVADEGVPTREIAGIIGRHLDVPVESVAPEDAPAQFAWLAGFFGVDSPASSVLTRKLLGWEPTQPGLIADLDEGHYFSC